MGDAARFFEAGSTTTAVLLTKIPAINRGGESFKVIGRCVACSVQALAFDRLGINKLNG